MCQKIGRRLLEACLALAGTLNQVARLPAFGALALIAAAARGAEVPEVREEPVKSALSVHGYLTQAYAQSDGHQILGIGPDGSSDYRDLALQFRYDHGTRNAFVLQLGHERMGDSPLGDSMGDLAVDWAFYQRQLTPRVALKVGRVPIPLGIYNESRNAGTTFPFYRPASGFYGEGQFAHETVEGASITARADLAGGWNGTADVYFGEWKFVQEDFETEAEVDDAVGGQLWLNTPIVGVRFGTGFYRATVTNLLYTPPGTEAIHTGLHGSVEIDFDRWRAAAEARSVDAEVGRYSSAYLQGGFELHPRWSVHARAETSRLDLRGGRIAVDREIDRDLALAINYEIASAVILKLEGHSNVGLLVEDVSVDIGGPAYRTRYFMLSLAASF